MRWSVCSNRRSRLPTSLSASEQRRAFIAMLDRTRTIGHNLGYGVGDEHGFTAREICEVLTVHLAVAIRISSAVTEKLTAYCRFPAHEEVQFSGFDGIVENPSVQNAYVPLGRSVWELSTERSPQSKAQRDYLKRTQYPEFDPAECTYVALTAKRWDSKQKAQWISNKRRDNVWRDVKVYDAADLED